MDEFRFFTYSLPGSDEIFNEKLSSVSDSINKQKVINPPWVAALGQSPVSQIAVASSHIAILLEDGRICRIAYSLNAEHIESNKNDSKSLWSAKKPKKKSARLIGGLTGAERVPYRRNVTSATIGSSSSNAGASGGSGSAPSRPGRPNYRNLFMSSVPFIPPSQVPEDLIVQVQNVLQGKSRSLIIRELQRTNLDVNSAVNNLLSRDDEDGEDDEVGDLFADDLMSFVENNLSERAGNYILESEQMLVEDYLNYATAYRSSSSAANVGRQRLSLRNEILRSTGISSSADRGTGNSGTGASAGGGSNSNPIGSSATGASGGSNPADGSGQPWELGGTDSTGLGGGIKGGPKSGAEFSSTVTGSGGSNDVITWEEPEWFILLPDAVSSPPPKFVQIAAMHSELVALSKSGQVYQWKWNVSMPFVHPDIADVHHPRIAHLDLHSEVIVSLAASSLRCSVLTQSGRVATWMDPVVASYCSKLEHGAIPVIENPNCSGPEAIKELKVCDLFTVAVAYSAKLFWWGVAPFAQRRKLLEKQAASKNNSSSSGSGSSRYSSVNDAFASRSGDGGSHLGQQSQQTVAITEGCLVTKKKSPMYHAGAIGFCCDATFPPKVGQLMEDIWNLDASCRFKILPLEKKRGDDCKKTEMLPPPSPVSVGSEGSHKSSSRKRRRSVSPHPFAQQPLIEEEIEEYWNPKNVVFLEDSQNIPIGTVLKVDGNIAVVKFPSDKQQQQQQQQVVVTGVCSSISNENSNHSTSGGDEQQQNSILRDCRLFHKSDLQALKSNALPKFMDCMQCQPKNILSNCAALDKLHLLSVAVDCKGVHVVASASQFKFYYCVIEPSSGAVEERRSFFTDLPAFIGLKNPISLQVAPEDPGRLLMDGNGCFYPLSKDDAGQMREPSTLNMLPIKTAAIGVHHVREGAPSIQRVLLTAFITKSSPTMTAVLQCNQHLVEMRLAEYELNPDKEGPMIVAERCDGNRNIIHALVSMGKPTANTSQQQSSGSSKCAKDDGARSHQTSSSGAIVSDANQATGNSNSSAATATSIIQTPIDADRVIAHFEQQQHPSSGGSSVQVATSTAASLTAATNALQNGAEILRRLREEMNAATEAARRQLALPGTAFDTAIPTIAWPPDPPAYENVPLSTGSLLDIPSATSSASRAAAASMGPILSSAITSCLSNTLTSNSLTNQSGLATGGNLSNPSGTMASNRNNQQQHQQQSPATTPSTDEERQKAALKILILLLTFSRADFEKRLIELLSLQDGRGMTPLMLAVNLRAYNMAMLIFNAAKRLATDKSTKKVNEELLMSMVFPPACASRARQLAANVNCASSGTSNISNGRATGPIGGQQQHQQQMLRRDDPDYSPLYMVCGNDNCSFTWTGSLHINQDIFECRTCGLHDTYCCCTECAKTCHKGHDCKLKKIWPTAYCDCWRRGRCCALIEGDQKARYDLLIELLQHTNLAAVPNRKGEHLLLCLVNTISRQMLEQSGLAKSGGVGIGGSGSNANKNSSRHHPVETENLDGMPDHNLDPPKFCRMALCQTVVNWKAVSSLMLQNASNSSVLGGNDEAITNSAGSNSAVGLYDDLSPQQSAYLKSQTGSAKLDAFTYKLIVKCKNDTGFVTLEKLCETLVSQLKKEKDGGSANNYAETMLVVRRFVRSVCRVFVVLSMETQSSKNKVISSEPLRKCKTVFRMLMGVAIEELVETADCLLAPVRMGVARPTRPFISLSTTDEKQGSAELFSMEPLPPRRSAIAAAAGSSTSVTFALDNQIQQQSRNSNNTLNASSTNERSSARDRTDFAHSSRRTDLNVERGLNTMEETIPGLTLTQSSRRDRLDTRVGSGGASTSAGHLGSATADNGLLDFLADGISQQTGNQRFEEPGTGSTVVDGGNTASAVEAADAAVALQLDAFTAATEEHHDNLGDHDDLDDDEDGHGSSADGGVVGEDDVTFEVDMMEEEEEEEEEDEESDNGGVVDNDEDNSEDEEEEDEDDDDDDDDDLDVPSGGEEQHHHHHSQHHPSHRHHPHHHHHHSQHPLASSHPTGGLHSATQAGSNVPGSRSSSTGPNALTNAAGVGGGRDSRASSPPPRPPLSARGEGDPSDISAPHSPILDSTRTTIDSAGDLAYFSNSAIGSSSGPGLRDRAIIGGASDGGVMSDGEESRSSSQDDESEVGADQGHRGGENELVDDLYLTESTLDAAAVDNLGGGGQGSSNSNQSASRNVPVAIQWAVGGQPVVVPAPPTRGMIYVDPATIRRGGVSNAAAVAAGAGGSLAAAAVNLGAGVPGSSLGSSAAAESTCSSTATNVSLSRAFSLIMRSVTELVFLAAEEETDGGYMTQQQFDALQEYVDKRLYITWEWLSSVLDSAEAQLRFGAALINSTDTNHPLHPLNASQRRGGNNGSNSNGGAGQNSNSNSSSESNSLSNSRRAFEGGVSRSSSRSAQQDSSAARKDFLNYILSLMRAHSNEHADALPVIDVSAFKHIAYVLDAMLYYLKNGKEAVVKSQDVNLVGPTGDANSVTDELDDYDPEDDSLDEAIFVGLTTGSGSIDDFTPVDAMSSKKGFSFFRRSPSTLCLGATSPDPFSLSYAEALPLAERPQLLTPHATKEEMFGPARFDQGFTLERNQGPSSSMGANETLTIRRSEVEIVPLRMDMDGRIESGYERLLVHDARVNSAEVLDRQDVAGQRSPEFPFYGNASESATASGARRASTGMSEGEPEIITERQSVDDDDDLEPGALDMSSSTLNAAEAAERQLQTDGNEAGPVAIRDRTGTSDMDFEAQRNNDANWNRDVLAAGPGSSTPNRDSFNSMAVQASTTDVHTIQDMIEEVTTSTTVENVTDFTYTLRKLPRVPKVVETNFNRDVLLGRWSHSLELFGRVFIDDVGAQPGSLLAEISSFDVREARFKKEMERIRNSQTRDLALDVERDKSQLILQTMRQLNSQYSKRSSFPGQPLAVHKVKVTFKNEPGEGTGVSRSFYTAIAQALLTEERLPKLDSLSAANNSVNTPMSRIRKVRTSTNLPSATSHFANQLSSYERRSAAAALILGGSSASAAASLNNAASIIASHHGRSHATSTVPGSTTTSAGAMGTSNVATVHSSSSAPSLTAANSTTGASGVTLNVNAAPYIPSASEIEDDSLRASIYAAVVSLQPSHASKITGMLLDLERHHLLLIKSDPDLLREKVEEALGLILSCAGGPAGANTGSGNSQSGSKSGNENSSASMLGDAAAVDDDESAPLFYQPGKTGFYSPRLGKCTKERLDVFRNVGRLIGLCLLQNELIPLPLNRHVLKYILHKELSWHDFAFFDPVTYESMRKLVLDAMDPAAGAEMFKELCLTYSVVLCKEEGGGEVELVPNGAKYEVTPKNVFDFVRRYCEYRMRQCMEKPLRMIRRGVYEVVPPSALSDLTAEDLRLLLNGTSTIDPKQLSSFTNFIDETGGDHPEKIRKFKRSFWTVVEKMTQKELQDLMYFWTGSPSVPASEEGFQPMPSITLRPADDNYFPSANTCISRLYIPLYSSKNQLKFKLLQAIQVKSFGFV